MAKKKKTVKQSGKGKRKTRHAARPATSGQEYDRQPFGEIFLDKDGRWFHCGEEITHALTIELFNRSVVRDPSGGYRLQVGREWARIRVEDTPYFVRSVDFSDGKVLLGLNDKTREPLAPETLRVGKKNVLYCEVKAGQFPARFTRPAYYQLMTRLGEDRRGFFIEYNKMRWYVRTNQDVA